MKRTHACTVAGRNLLLYVETRKRGKNHTVHRAKPISPAVRPESLKTTMTISKTNDVRAEGSVEGETVFSHAGSGLWCKNGIMLLLL